MSKNRYIIFTGGFGAGKTLRNHLFFMESVKHMKAYTIDTDGTVREVEPANGNKFSLTEIHEFVGTSNIEFLTTHEGDWIIVDEDARLKPDQKVNVRASLLYKHGYHQQLLGKVFVCKASLIK